MFSAAQCEGSSVLPEERHLRANDGAFNLLGRHAVSVEMMHDAWIELTSPDLSFTSSHLTSPNLTIPYLTSLYLAWP